MKAVIVAHALATLAMFGVIWIVQLVHYPLFAGVGADGFVDYEAEHQRRITLVVMPLMLIELATAVWLVFNRPAAWPVWTVWLGLALVGVIWLSTAALQVPMHTQLSGGFDAVAHARLVTTNWIRTLAWTLRAGLVGWLLYRMF